MHETTFLNGFVVGAETVLCLGAVVTLACIIKALNKAIATCHNLLGKHP